MADRYADFDAAFAELDAKPLIVKLYGREWELPATISAAAVLKVAHWMADGREEQRLSTAELVGLAGDLIPRNVLDEWTARGLDAERLSSIITWACEQYMGEMPDGGDDPEAQAPAVGAPGSSSPAGSSSKPTSPANTDSTSPERSAP